MLRPVASWSKPFNERGQKLLRVPGWDGLGRRLWQSRLRPSTKLLGTAQLLEVGVDGVMFVPCQPQRAQGVTQGDSRDKEGAEHVLLTLSPCSQQPDPAAGPVCAGAIRCSHFGAIYNPNCCLQLVSCCQSRCGRGAEVVSPRGGVGGWMESDAGTCWSLGMGHERGCGHAGVATGSEHRWGWGPGGPMCCTSSCSMWCRVAAVTDGSQPGLSLYLLFPELMAQTE